MNTYTTTLLAQDVNDGIIKKFVGPNIKAPTLELAEQYVQLNGMGYLTVIGQLIQTIDEHTNQTTDYNNYNLN